MNRQASESLLPGQDLVEQGLADLAHDRLTDCSLLVLIAAPRLRRLGIQIPDRPCPGPYEHCLYARLEERLGPAAHSHYNSLIRRIVSFARALEREKSREDETQDPPATDPCRDAGQSDESLMQPRTNAPEVLDREGPKHPKSAKPGI